MRHDLISMININPDSVLELGGGDFDTLKFVVDKYQSKGTGIDIRIPQNYKKADFDLILGDLDDLNLFKKLPNNSFDLIIAGDVLEHLKNPEKIISILKSKLRLNGEFILSVPNIRNVKASIQIFVRGRFPRHDSGLFDKTHLSWFTSKDIKDICIKQGFQIAEYQPLGRIRNLGIKRQSIITEFGALQHGLRLKKVK